MRCLYPVIFRKRSEMKKNLYRELLKTYCDALISVQDKSGNRALRGGVYCRACKMIHGRCPDAVFGLVVMAKLSGEKKYLESAKEVFSYGKNMLCADGGMYNDAQSTWRYTTTFHEIAVIEALRAGKDILDEETKSAFEERARRMAEWLYSNLNERSPANINYATTNGLALALAGNQFQDERYLKQARRLIDYAMAHISESGFLFGESKPHDKKSDKGCVSVDIGYNAEESLPALVKYAVETKDEALREKLVKIVGTHLKFMFPDGGWDNSFGNRNNKWTYWGSRTSDGCAPMFLLLADKNPAFAEAALRNTEMLAKCTNGGFLYGGPDYYKHGEYACTHHLFEHLNSLAFALEYIEEKYLFPDRGVIPADREEGFDYYPEIRTYKLTKGKYSATVTDYDFDVFFSGHATGGTLTALFHREKGPMIMASVTDYVLVEPTNMQQVLDRDRHRSLTPRFEVMKNGVKYASSYYGKAEISALESENGYTVYATTGLCSDRGETLENVIPKIGYELNENGLRIFAENASEVRYILPLICGECKILQGKIEKREEIFFLTSGFIACEYTVLPVDGKLELKIC